MDCSKAASSYGFVVRDGNGVIRNSTLKSDPNKASSFGGATYFYENARVLLEKCVIAGHFGIHAIGKSHVEASACQISAPGGCYCTTDPSPVSSTIIARGCSLTGKKSDMKVGSSLVEC